MKWGAQCKLALTHCHCMYVNVMLKEKRIAQLFTSSVCKQNTADIRGAASNDHSLTILNYSRMLIILWWLGRGKSFGMIWGTRVYGYAYLEPVVVVHTWITLLTLTHRLFVMYTWDRMCNLLKEILYLHHLIKHYI